MNRATRAGATACPTGAPRAARDHLETCPAFGDGSMNAVWLDPAAGTMHVPRTGRASDARGGRFPYL
jgi:hypothetical protein